MNASFRQHAERFESVSQEVLNNAPLQELQQRVTSVLAGVDGRVARVEGEVRSKAWITSVESTEQTVVSLGACLGPRPVPVSRNSCSRRCSPPCVLPAAARQEDMQRQLQVALRFVEWFSRRGESYEHNAAAIENHMKELAMTAHSRRVAGGVPECQPACSGSAACGCGCGGGAGSRHGGGSSHRAQPHTHAH